MCCGYFLGIVQKELLKRCPDVPPTARFGAVSFMRRFGAALNEHIHVHCYVVDALFSLDDDTLRISELPGLSEAAITSIQIRCCATGRALVCASRLGCRNLQSH
ncbi:MAG TPA: hypothetical protein DIW77_19255 [Chromatiaceae bacterium]|nr:MAG: hypothetical protein N838_34030 [Thiohalocapsa sp. PB-PSB1]HCS92105.1 hypothetical protein [Chromatiaceae bacterium]